MTEADLDAIWKDDRLGRRQDAEFLATFLVRRLDERAARGVAKSYVLNLDAGWGHGKTFFLERFGQQLEAQGHLVAMVNAWKDDHADDPLLAVMAGIDRAVKPYIRGKETLEKGWKSVTRWGGAVVWAAGKGILRHQIKKHAGDAFNDAMAASEAEIGEAAGASTDAIVQLAEKAAGDLLANFEVQQRTIEHFRSGLKDFLGAIGQHGRNPPLFVLIDELDRCRPGFAITLLERVKHLFDIDDVVFVVATNTTQLAHAVRAVYGTGFDAERYLFRFFDRTYVFEEPDLGAFMEQLFDEYQIKENVFRLPRYSNLCDYASGCFKYYGLGLRDAHQCFDILRSCVTSWKSTIKLEVCILLPLIVGFHMGLPLDLSEKLDENLDNIRDKNGSTYSGWKLKFIEDDRLYGGNKLEKHYECRDVLKKISILSSRKLPDIIRDNSGNHLNRWVNQIADLEISARNLDTYDPSDPPYSVIRDYPALVRSAGRLTGPT